MSLLQLAVSLYLLYLQVGLAFIAGVAFGVLLVPINRWIAVSIGRLSTKMMTQKDARVKVSEISVKLFEIFYIRKSYDFDVIFSLLKDILKTVL